MSNPLKILVKDCTFNTTDYSRIFPVENFHLLALFWILIHPRSFKATGNILLQVCHLKHQILRFVPGAALQAHCLSSRGSPPAATEVSCWDVHPGSSGWSYKGCGDLSTSGRGTFGIWGSIGAQAVLFPRLPPARDGEWWGTLGPGQFCPTWTSSMGNRGARLPFWAGQDFQEATPMSEALHTQFSFLSPFPS